MCQVDVSQSDFVVLSVLQAVTKGRARAVVGEVVLSPTIGIWPSFCVSLSISSGHGFISEFWMVLVPMEGGVGSTKCTKLPVILKPSFQWEGLASRDDDTLVANQL